MLKFMYLEINLVGIIIVLLLKRHKRKETVVSMDQIIYDKLLTLTQWVLILDTSLWIVDGLIFNGNIKISYVIGILYHIVAYSIPVVWFLYTVSSVRSAMPKYKRKYQLGLIPYVICVLLAITSPWTKLVFYITEDNFFVRGILAEATVLISFLYSFAASIYAFKQRKKKDNESEKRQCDLLAFLPFPLFALSIIQGFFYGCTLEWITLALGMLVLFLDIQSKKIDTDGLTGLNNRLSFDREILLKAKELDDDEKLVLIMIDVDRFKEINDTLGHISGDKALMRVTNILQKACKGHNTFISRYGGDEFTILLQVKRQAEIDELLILLENNIRYSNKNSRENYVLELSVGYSVWKREEQETIEDFVSRADEEMYAAKNASKR